MDTLRKVLVTDTVHEILLEGLTQAGFHCDYLPLISYEEVLHIIPSYEGLIINSKILVQQQLLDTATNLRFVGRLGSGLEIIDLHYARQRQVRVYSSPEGNCDAVAEHALAMLLALAINLRQADTEVRQFCWEREKNRGWELMGKTIGIIGCGYTGRAFAQRLMGFGMNVLAYDKYKVNYTQYLPHVHATTMQRLWEEADIVSLHLPLTAENQHLVDADWLAKFHHNIVLINTSRGNVVYTPHLLDALDSGKVQGACLDVFENEKPQTYSASESQLYANLAARSNVLLTPHIAGWTHESKERLARVLLYKILEDFR